MSYKIIKFLCVGILVFLGLMLVDMPTKVCLGIMLLMNAVVIQWRD